MKQLALILSFTFLVTVGHGQGLEYNVLYSFLLTDIAETAPLVDPFEPVPEEYFRTAQSPTTLTVEFYSGLNAVKLNGDSIIGFCARENPGISFYELLIRGTPLGGVLAVWHDELPLRAEIRSHTDGGAFCTSRKGILSLTPEVGGILNHVPYLLQVTGMHGPFTSLPVEGSLPAEEYHPVHQTTGNSVLFTSFNKYVSFNYGAVYGEMIYESAGNIEYSLSFRGNPDGGSMKVWPAQGGLAVEILEHGPGFSILNGTRGMLVPVSTGGTRILAPPEREQMNASSPPASYFWTDHTPVYTESLHSGVQRRSVSMEVF